MIRFKFKYGVEFVERGAKIMVSGKTVYLGSFDTKEAAAAAYDAAAAPVHSRGRRTRPPRVPATQFWIA